MSGKKNIEMFRVKIHPAKQGQLMSNELAPRARVQAVVECIQGKPEFNTDAESVWRIGDVRASQSGGGVRRLAFEFGKTSLAEDVDFDENKKVYRSDKRKHVNYTMVYMEVVDEGNIFSGILSPPHTLAPRATRVADALRNTLNKRLSDTDKDVEVSFDAMYNMTKIEQQLRDAYAVKMLSVSFGRPNHPLDVKSMLYKHATEMNEEMEAKESTHTFKGESLSGAVDFAKSAADGGFPVKAEILETANSSRKRKIDSTKQGLEAIPIDEGAEDQSVFGAIAHWIKSRKGDRGKS